MNDRITALVEQARAAGDRKARDLGLDFSRFPNGVRRMFEMHKANKGKDDSPLGNAEPIARNNGGIALYKGTLGIDTTSVQPVVSQIAGAVSVSADGIVSIGAAATARFAFGGVNYYNRWVTIRKFAIHPLMLAQGAAVPLCVKNEGYTNENPTQFPPVNSSQLIPASCITRYLVGGGNFGYDDPAPLNIQVNQDKQWYCDVFNNGADPVLVTASGLVA